MDGTAEVQSATRAVLTGVPRVAFYAGGKRCPEDITFPACLRAVLEYLRDDFGCNHLPKTKRNLCHNCTYAYLVGVSGAAASMMWEDGRFISPPDRLFSAGGAGSPVERAFRAIGYEYEYLRAKEGQDAEAMYSEAIRRSIGERKMPVIAFGVAGPGEAGIITGYDEGGEVLTGWSFFQEIPEFKEKLEFEPNSYFRARGAYRDLKGIILIGEKRALPKPEVVYHQTMAWLVELARCAEGPEAWRGKVNGLAAYQAWADWLRDDANFEWKDEGTLKQCFEANDMLVGHVAEARWYGGPVFMGQAAVSGCDGGKWSEEILHAAGEYAAEHSLMWQMWDAVGGIGPGEEKPFTLAKPEVRQKMAAIVEAARDKEAEAAEWIERALQKM